MIAVRRDHRRCAIIHYHLKSRVYCVVYGKGMNNTTIDASHTALLLLPLLCEKKYFFFFFLHVCFQ